MSAVIESPVKMSLTRVFDADPQLLFDAWLRDDMGDWLLRDGSVCLSCEIDPRVGGQWRVLSRMPDGAEILLTGIYRQIEPPALNWPGRLVFTWNAGFSGPNTTLVSLVFKPRNGGTELTLTHEGFITEELGERHVGGWGGSLERLAHYLG